MQTSSSTRALALPSGAAHLPACRGLEAHAPSDTITGVSGHPSESAPIVPSPFPVSPRTVFRVNPLVEVVCQLRFPALLRVDVEPPAAFQERIRAEYPVLKDKTTDLLGLPPELP